MGYVIIMACHTYILATCTLFLASYIVLMSVKKSIHASRKTYNYLVPPPPPT